ncbi:MAG: hypothetical protein MZV63_24005 [Marinilabiliales bacterium]|nr:hypothetical protein [Marinilabiliales bacterium]
MLRTGRRIGAAVSLTARGRRSHLATACSGCPRRATRSTHAPRRQRRVPSLDEVTPRAVRRPLAESSNGDAAGIDRCVARASSTCSSTARSATTSPPTRRRSGAWPRGCRGTASRRSCRRSSRRRSSRSRQG